MERFGRTLLFIVFLLALLWGAMLLTRMARPFVSRVPVVGPGVSTLMGMAIGQS